MGIGDYFTKADDKSEDIKKLDMNELFRSSQETLSNMQKHLNAPVLTYYNSTAGSICDNDAMVLYELLRHKKKIDHLYFFITSDGGRGIAALKMMSVLRNFCSKISVLINSTCASAATMLALGADEIIMTPLAYLSAVDSSITHDLSPIDKDNNLVSVSMDELNRVLKLWKESVRSNLDDISNSKLSQTQFENLAQNPYPSLYEHIHPLVFGAVDRASSLSLKISKEMLMYHLQDEAKISSIASKLNCDYPSHSYPILLKEAQQIGLNASRMDDELANILQELSLIYMSICKRKYVDYDENNYHDSNILNFLELDGRQVYYQTDKDWHYKSESRRWVSMNDNSDWFENTFNGKQILKRTISFR